VCDELAFCIRDCAGLLEVAGDFGDNALVELVGSVGEGRIEARAMDELLAKVTECGHEVDELVGRRVCDEDDPGVKIGGRIH
jgi:hypothetical protein